MIQIFLLEIQEDGNGGWRVRLPGGQALIGRVSDLCFGLLEREKLNEGSGKRRLAPPWLEPLATRTPKAEANMKLSLQVCIVST